MIHMIFTLNRTDFSVSSIEYVYLSSSFSPEQKTKPLTLCGRRHQVNKEIPPESTRCLRHHQAGEGGVWRGAVASNSVVLKGSI